MAISFEIPEKVLTQQQMAQAMADGIMRPVSRQLDENEHERPDDFIKMMWPAMRDQHLACIITAINYSGFKIEYAKSYRDSL